MRHVGFFVTVLGVVLFLIVLIIFIPHCDRGSYKTCLVETNLSYYYCNVTAHCNQSFYDRWMEKK
jgi:hypothetical protein